MIRVVLFVAICAVVIKSFFPTKMYLAIKKAAFYYAISADIQWPPLRGFMSLLICTGAGIFRINEPNIFNNP